MPSYKAALVAIVAVALAPTHAALGDEPRQRDGRIKVIAFGDSLLDAGTYSPFAGATFGGGRFTTNPGRNFTQDVAHHYGDRLTPAFLGGFGAPLSPAGGLDYAQGGSRVKDQPGIGHAPEGNPNSDFAALTTVPIKDQVQTYLSSPGWPNGRTFSSDQLVLINGGANDLFFQLGVAQNAGFTPTALNAAFLALEQSAIDLAGIVSTVVENGATHVAVMNIPDIGNAPLGGSEPSVSGYSQLLTQFSQGFNATLAAALKTQISSGKVILIDAFSYVDSIIANFRTYGFSASNTGFACNLQAQVKIAAQLGLPSPNAFNTSLFCSPKTYVALDADYTYMFADLVHPTTHLNALFAQFVEQAIAQRHWHWEHLEATIAAR
jgi:phospholipase/lecithinase/hemolysin